ncbi:MAG: peptidylprolyl isomerase [Candidatus Latescibacteria bacterium]|nr:peptidylprolyl isomerase [Candidatus Latescibacterota bacterium]
MRTRTRYIAALFIMAVLAGSARPGVAADGLIPITITTEFGEVEAVLDSAHAPVTVTNFLRYVDGGLYVGGVFHRAVTIKPDNQPNQTVKIEVIQAGINPALVDKGFPAVPLERTNKTGLSHKNGTISMARREPDTATSDFFICIGDQPSLDFGGKRNPDGQGFAAFGTVVKGMDIVKRIQAAPVDGQKLTSPVRIVKVVRRR